MNKGTPVPGFLLCQPFPVRPQAERVAQIGLRWRLGRGSVPAPIWQFVTFPRWTRSPATLTLFSLAVSLPLLSLLNVCDLPISSVIAPPTIQSQSRAPGGQARRGYRVPIISPTKRAIDCTFHIGIAALLLQYRVRDTTPLIIIL